MADEILSTRTLIDHTQLSTDEGITVPIPTATLRLWLRRGLTEATLHFDLVGLDADHAAQPAGATHDTTRTISIREAARRLIARLEPLHPSGVDMPVETARSRVRSAVASGHLPQPITDAALTAWVDAEVDAYLDSLDSQA